MPRNARRPRSAARASEIVGGTGADVWNGTAKVLDAEGRDRTQAFLTGAKKAMEICKRCGAHSALVSNSPSCGYGTIYDGSFGDTKRGGKRRLHAAVAGQGRESRVRRRRRRAEMIGGIQMRDFNDYRDVSEQKARRRRTAWTVTAVIAVVLVVAVVGLAVVIPMMGAEPGRRDASHVHNHAAVGTGRKRAGEHIRQEPGRRHRKGDRAERWWALPARARSRPDSGVFGGDMQESQYADPAS